MSRIFHTSLEPRSRRGDYRSSDSPEARPEPLKAEPATTDTKARIFPFRNSGHRSRTVLDSALFQSNLASSGGNPSVVASRERSGSGSGGEGTADMRQKTLFALESRDPRPTTGAVLASARSSSPIPLPTSLYGALDRPRAQAQVRCVRVLSARAARCLQRGGGRAQGSGACPPEDIPMRTVQLTVEPNADEHGLSTYASATFLNRPVEHRFAQAGPFAMTLSASEEVDGSREYQAALA